jgi:hypothetical protein
MLMSMAASAGAAGQGGELTAWASDVALPHHDLDRPPGAEAAGPVKIVGVRNGTFSGKVVVACDSAIRGLDAQMSRLSAKDGSSIPASAVRVSFAGFVQQGGWRVVPKAISYFDPLLAAPPAAVEPLDREVFKGKKVEGARQPIWVTVKIPADAKPGEYSATLKVSAKGAEAVTVPIELTVIDWSLPPAGELEPFVELIQSPESIALAYDAELWSERHFELMGKSLELMGQLHSRSVYIPLIRETNQGNEQSMVRWIAQPDGSYKYDLSVMDRYLDLACERMGKPENVILYVWDLFLDGGQFDGDIRFIPEQARNERLEYKGKGPSVTVVDGKTGEIGSVILPQYSDEASKALWAPLMAQIREHLAKRGLDKAVMLGCATDSIPAPAVIDFFGEVMPKTPWTIASHGVTYGGKSNKLAAQGAPVVFGATVGGQWATDAPGKRTPGWQGQWVHFHRALRDNHPMPIFRMMIEMNITANYKGVARIGADFWPVLKNRRGQRVVRLFGRYPKSMWRNLDIQATLLGQGPDGALPTARFEMLREGLQECQARIFIERTLRDEKALAAIDKDLAARCQNLLDERTAMIRKCISGGWRGMQFNCLSAADYENYAEADWQQHSAKLYKAAADLNAALKR